MKAPRAERGPVPISGYLHKMKSTERVLASQWNKRFFALEGRVLKYYQHESSLEASKTIDLLSIESIRRFENGDHGVFSFVLKTPARSYFLRAESKGDMKRWVRGLRDQQDLWRAKEDKGAATAGGDPAATTARKPKHYSDIPFGTPTLVFSQRSASSLHV
ncbi:hypothetical protein PybrP1_010882 [[Pythium] brassicae (nom. inval.)]|nr:hypothetical protein PybrP1_010882 [[Pythium] brassicae (nom. inval.)]